MTTAMVKTIQQRIEDDVKARIVNDLKEHQVTALKVDGTLYRHYRCQRPKSWIMGFDIVTWPGSLCFTGDMGDYLFQREPDMIAFMKQVLCKGSIDYRYLAEKYVATKIAVREWNEDAFREVLAERQQNANETSDGKFRVHFGGGRIEERSVAEAIEEIETQYSVYESPHDAQRAMYESGLWDGGYMPSCEVWSLHFLWCLHAIKWFCERVQ